MSTLALPMGQPHVRKVLRASAAATSTGNTDLFQVSAFSAADILLDVTAASGTSPTLDLYIQKRLPDSSTWQDIAHFAQNTGSAGKQILSFVSSGNSIAAVQTDALTVNTVKTTLIGAEWRVRWVVGGTSPSFSFAVFGDFFV